MRRSPLAILLVLLVSVTLSAETWLPTEVTCPVCGTVNVFQVPGSYGSYVFRDPSRFQFVFWPATTDTFLYTCRECHLSAFMGDFQQIAPAKVEELAEMLRADVMIDGPVVPYFDIPMAARLAVAEKVYEILGGDAAFWGTFHRIAGYHYAKAGLEEKAANARRKALEIAEKAAAEETPKDRKEALVVVAAMRFHLGDVDAAREALSEAAAITYRSPNGRTQESEGRNRFLDELIEAFRAELLR